MLEQVFEQRIFVPSAITASSCGHDPVSVPSCTQSVTSRARVTQTGGRSLIVAVHCLLRYVASRLDGDQGA
jgi:hypothetical protein